MKRRLATGLAIRLAVLLAAGPAISAEQTVRPDGSGDRPTIQAALDAAADGDLIRLAPGVYGGPGNLDLDFRGKAVTLLGDEEAPETCVLDLGTAPAGTAGRAFFFHTFETRASQVRGLAMIRGDVPAHPESQGLGGAVLCLGASPTFAACLFRENWALNGGAVAIQNGAPLFRDCRFQQNSAEIGGAVFSNPGDPGFSGSTFAGNTAARGGGLSAMGGTVKVSGCVFYANSATQGGAVAADRSAILILESSLLDNNFASFGGAVFVQSAAVEVRRSTLAWNSAGSGGGIHLGAGAQASLRHTLITGGVRGAAFGAEGSATLDVACSLVWGNAGGDWTGPAAHLAATAGNLELDPQLQDPDARDFRPRPGSPCPIQECGAIGAFR
ncbi:MAG: right-handed parallel beta-helix repeat-containing protein [Candidatus Krumholzibacteriia bacterium]